MKKSVSGFTLVELIIVICVIALLAAIVTVSYSPTKARARDTTRRSDIANIVKGLELYYDDNGSYPAPGGTNWYYSTDSTWSSLVTALTGKISSVPSSDPTNSGSPTTAGKFGYAYYSSGSYCGRAAGQWYLLVYRFEVGSQTKFSDGTCGGTEYGDTFYSAGASYYRSVK